MVLQIGVALVIFRQKQAMHTRIYWIRMNQCWQKSLSWGGDGFKFRAAIPSACGLANPEVSSTCPIRARAVVVMLDVDEELPRQAADSWGDHLNAVFVPPRTFAAGYFCVCWILLRLQHGTAAKSSTNWCGNNITDGSTTGSSTSTMGMGWFLCDDFFVLVMMSSSSSSSSRKAASIWREPCLERARPLELAGAGAGLRCAAALQLLFHVELRWRLDPVNCLLHSEEGPGTCCLPMPMPMLLQLSEHGEEARWRRFGCISFCFWFWSEKPSRAQQMYKKRRTLK